MRKILFIIVFSVVVFGWSNFSRADDVGCIPPSVNFINCFRAVINPSRSTFTASSFILLAETIAGFLMVIGAIIAGIVIIVSGIMYMGAGSDTAKVTSAKTVFKNGIIGALIFFAVGIIINTIALIAYRPFEFFF